MSKESNFRYDYVRSKVDGLAYIMKYIKLKRIGGVFRGLCPFHNEKTPSLTVYPPGHVNNGQKQEHTSFYCFGCDAGGDVISFAKRKHGFDTKLEACRHLEHEFGIEIDDESLQVTMLKEQLDRQQKVQESNLSLAEVNLICSSFCRNYLNWVKENASEYLQEEVDEIDKLFIWLDNQFLELNAIQASNLFEDVAEKVNNRRLSLFDKIQQSRTD